MKFVVALTQILSFAFVLGCSSGDEPLNRLLYEGGQNYDRNQCQQNPTAECKTRKSYEQYKREREDLLKKEDKGYE